MSPSPLAKAGLVAVVAAAAALVVYLGVEALREGPATAPTTDRPPVRPEPEKAPLAAEATTLQGLWDLAWTAARTWRPDARLTRMYATGIRKDGTFDRGRSDVQFVFLSKELSATGMSTGSPNGLRWSLSQGKTSTMELKQYPSPGLDMPQPSLCELSALLGDTAPAEVVVDVFFVEHDGKAPGLSAFSEDRTFMAVADPVTCEVRGRSTKATAEELDGGSAAQLDAGRVFDFAKASAAVEAVLASASKCKRPGDPTGPGTVSVRFDQRGKVDEVSFPSGGYGGTGSGRCLEERLRKVHVGAWDSGRGYIIKRFQL